MAAAHLVSTDEYCGLKILLMGLVAAAPRVFIDIDSDSGEKKGGCMREISRNKNRIYL